MQPKDLFNNKYLSDFQITIDKEQIFLHRTILIQRSSYFQNLFKMNPNQTKLDLTSYDKVWSPFGIETIRKILTKVLYLIYVPQHLEKLELNDYALFIRMISYFDIEFRNIKDYINDWLCDIKDLGEYHEAIRLISTTQFCDKVLKITMRCKLWGFISMTIWPKEFHSLFDVYTDKISDTISKFFHYDSLIYYKSLIKSLSYDKKFLQGYIGKALRYLKITNSKEFVEKVLESCNYQKSISMTESHMKLCKKIISLADYPYSYYGPGKSEMTNLIYDNFVGLKIETLFRDELGPEAQQLYDTMSKTWIAK